METESERFSTDVAFPISPQAVRFLNPKLTYHHVLRASILLGRIMALQNHLHISHDCSEYMIEFANLENALSSFKVALSQSLQGDHEQNSREENFFCLLNALTHTCSILLFHPVESGTTLRHQDDSTEAMSGYSRCLTATRLAIGVMKRLASESPETLVNPFLVMDIFLCSRFLVIAWRESGDSGDRNDIDYLLTLVSRIGEQWPSLAKKFRKGIVRDLEKGADEITEMRVGDGCYLDVECA